MLTSFKINTENEGGQDDDNDEDDIGDNDDDVGDNENDQSDNEYNHEEDFETEWNYFLDVISQLGDKFKNYWTDENFRKAFRKFKTKCSTSSRVVVFPL